MAARSVLMVPGTKFREFDISGVIRDLSYLKMAVVTPASKGVFNSNILITSSKNLEATFGVATQNFPGLLLAKAVLDTFNALVQVVRVGRNALAAAATITLLDTTTADLGSFDFGTAYNGLINKVSYTGLLANTDIVESHTFPALTRTTPITVGGTKKTGDVLNVVITDAALTGSPATASYTVQSGDADLTAVAAGLAAAISAVTGHALIGLTATNTGAVVNVVTNSANATSYSQSVTGSSPTTTLSVGSTVNVLTNTYTKTLANAPIAPSTVSVSFGGVIVATDNGIGGLTFKSGYTQYSGSVVYSTGVVTITTTNLTTANVVAAVDFKSNYWSAFNIQVIERTVDANNVKISDNVLEDNTGLTLANMLETLDKSVYIEPPDNAFSAFPVAGEYTFSGGDDGISGIQPADFIGSTSGSAPTGLQIFGDAGSIDINCVAIPEFSNQLPIRQALVTFCEQTRADCVNLLDPPAGLNPQQTADWANGTGNYSDNDNLQSTYSAVAFPHYGFYNSDTAEYEVAPPSVAVAATLANTQAWQAPAGFRRGKVANITSLTYNVNDLDRAFLQDNRINPIGRINGLGPAVIGQMTATNADTALNRLHVRIMLNLIEKSITTALMNILFEADDMQSWNEAIQLVQPYLDDLATKNRITSGKFFCDAQTNDFTDQNDQIMVADCAIQPIPIAEIILVNFVVTSVGAQISESVIVNATQS